MNDADGADYPLGSEIRTFRVPARPDDPWPPFPTASPFPGDAEQMTQRDVIAERRRTRRGPVHVQDSLGATSGGSQDFSRHVLVAKRTDGQDLPPFTPPSYAGDCGLDLALSQDVEVAPGGTANVPCGVAVALPHGTFGWITGRSSTWSKHGLIVMAGIIDEGWRGELRVMLYRPLTADPLGQCSILHLPRGTRVAQLIVLPNLLEGLQVHFVEPYVALPDSERGTNGFGSSGS